MTLTTSKPVLLTTAVVLTYAVCALSLKVCPNCGSTPVPYPLSTAPDCGDPLYKIRCNAESLLFDSVNNTYPITSISPSIQRLTIAPSPFLGNTCIASDLPSNGLQLNNSAPFNITSSNTIFYLNCSSSIMNSPLDCTSNSLCHVYINGTAGSGCVDAPLCCAFRAGGSTTAYRIRVRDSGCKAYRSFVNLDYGLPVSRWPPPGVELQWVLPIEPTCRAQGDCDSKSTCGPDPNSARGVSRCFCNSGLQWDPVAGLCATECKDPDGCGKDRTGLIAGLIVCIGVALLAALIGFLFYKRHQRIKREKERLTREREEILNSGGGKSAKKAIDFNRPQDDVNLAVYVQRLVEEERIMDAVDPLLKEGSSTLELETMKALGFLAVGCLEERRQSRPSMKEVAEEIEYIISIATAKATD
ncbi:unnamed protein product [Fraxinus pennsylvanica]|uniref:Wall-associated receptor kinase galacturonan-binding domain-containing protein n=1 Tax=Fraxinus pennsylvanica TaxID=56036 RepID=A0AAD1ZP73_9LAMI|nr:unnamed protein product [Fraxinus pennsylvanica]